MNQADGLVAAVLEHAEDRALWLVLSDWLKEQDDPASLARAELFHLRTEWMDEKENLHRQEKLDQRAIALLREHPDLIGALRPLVDRNFPLLSAPAALVMFLLADYTSELEGPIKAGTDWEGRLEQDQDHFPTILHCRTRTGNHFEGDMRQDFSSIYSSRITGRFFFRGVVIGKSDLAFVTYRMTSSAAGPGLYQFRLSQRKRWNGSWRIEPGQWGGKMWLKPKLPTSPTQDA
jgi:uncharacterized protein (TIGR02996 family)